MRRTNDPARPLCISLPTAAALAVCLPVAAGCNVDPFCLNCGDGAMPDGSSQEGGRPDAFGFPDAQFVHDAAPLDSGPDAGDGGADACLDEELCNSQDDDCDGQVDEGIDTSSDPANCGGCGQACELPHAFPSCQGGSCAIDECEPGWIDLDGQPGNGCEKSCPSQADDDSTCNLQDDDCDGQVDEDVDLQTDIDNCGQCGRSCVFQNATAACEGGECVIASCDSGFRDLDGVKSNGCEYPCSGGPSDETCNGQDDDCDGDIDEGNPEGGDPCGDGTGACTQGTETCVNGTLVCQGGTSGSAEICDANTASSMEEADNDCDGDVDENFDKQTDANNCGECGNECTFDNAFAACNQGDCQMVRCRSGFHDADGNASNGCELACDFQGTQELCNGDDDDCDGTIDEELSEPSGFCSNIGVCSEGSLECAGSSGWECNYPDNHQETETLCDGDDNDCDGRTDEAFPAVGDSCSRGTGACKTFGSFECNDAGDGVVCNADDPPDGSSEVCNGEDDDCDGTVDEDSDDDNDMVHIRPSWNDQIDDFYIDRYEASRPNATSSSPGSPISSSGTDRRCVRPGVMPWTNVDHTTAAEACAAAGKRLCTEAEWQAACAGSDGRSYPYGNDYDPQCCNGEEYDADEDESGDQDRVLATGTSYGCPTLNDYDQCINPNTNTIDMSGNVREWTSTQVGSSPPAYRIRGGSKDNIEPGLTCQFDFGAASEDFSFGNLGFRCCSDTAP